MKVSHSKQTAILQFVDPACTAAQEHVAPRIWNFHFLPLFCQIEIKKFVFFVWQFF